MAYDILKLAHVIGAVVIGGGLIGVWVSDMRSRQVRDLSGFSEAVRSIAVFYDGIVVPGALILLISGTWPQIRKRARDLGLEVLADATCPFVIQQEEAAEELLREGYNLVLLSSRTHHGIPRLTGIAQEVGREICVVENETEVDRIRLARNEPVGVIVQTTFWMESYKRIMARILERFANVRVRNMACVDSLHRLPVVEKMAKEVDALVIVGWTEGMTNRMLEVALSFNPKVYKIERVEQLQPEWVQGVSTVGVIGANETPDWMVDDVAQRIKAMAG